FNSETGETSWEAPPGFPVPFDATFDGQNGVTDLRVESSPGSGEYKDEDYKDDGSESTDSEQLAHDPPPPPEDPSPLGLKSRTIGGTTGTAAPRSEVELVRNPLARANIDDLPMSSSSSNLATGAAASTPTAKDNRAS